jgi:DNA-binding NarL/FixJ family response regulator
MSISSCTPGSPLPDPTVLIIDDHDLVATAIAMTLRSAGLQARRHVVRSREGVLLTIATLSPGVVLLDLDLGRDPDGAPIDGTTLIEGMCRSGWRVLALSGTSDDARLGKALAAGALAGIPKSAALPVLVTAVRRAAQGVEVMHPERRRLLIEAHLREQDRGRERTRASRSRLPCSRPAGAVHRGRVRRLRDDRADADPRHSHQAGGRLAAGGGDAVVRVPTGCAGPAGVTTLS